MFVTLVSELAYMVSITQFERSVKESNVFFLSYDCFNVAHAAVA